MAALAGEPWRGRARVEVTDVTTSKWWVDTVAAGDVVGDVSNVNDWDKLPGQTFTLRLGYDLGPTPIANPLPVAIVQTVIPGTTTVIGSNWTIDLPTSGSTFMWAQRQIHLDDNPLDTVQSALLRSGMLEIVLTLQRSGQATNNYTINSRGQTTGSPPAGMTHNHARGYVRSRFVLDVPPVVTRANAANDPPPLVYRDPSRTRWKPRDVAYAAYDPTVQHINPSTLAVLRAGATGGSVATATERTHNFLSTSGSRSGLAAVVDKDYPTAFAVDLVLPSATFGGQADNQFAWAASGAQPAGWAPSDAALRVLRNTALTFQAAPALTFTQHLQESLNTFATPPASIRETPPEMLSTVLGFIAARVQNARGEGVNHSTSGQGISYTFGDLQGLVAATGITNQPTVPAGGEAGWGPLFAWSASKPSGTWRNTVTFRDEAGVQGTALHDYVMLSQDPRIAPAVGGGSATAEADHFVPGDNLVVALAMFFGKTRGKLVPDAGSATCAVTRLNLATGTAQHLDSDGVWKDIGSGSAYFWPLLPSPTDAAVQRRVFGQGAVHTQVDTSTWGHFDIVLIAQASIGGTPYTRMGLVPVVGDANRHSGYEFDLIGHK